MVWRAEFPLGNDTPKFDMRTINVLTDRIASANDDGSIEIFDPAGRAAIHSEVTMDGFSDAYARLRKTCDASAHNKPGCILAGTPPRCSTDAFSAAPRLQYQNPSQWPNR
jgi:hypothetical protein